MDLKGFRATIEAGRAPARTSPALRALWTEAAGDWARAHEIVQDEGGEAAAWVHAYLHRKEGDLSNARYWYSRALQTPSSASHDEEWEQIVGALLGP